MHSCKGRLVRDSIADIESFRPALPGRPASIGMGGRLPSESVAGLRRNQWPLSVGLRSSVGFRIFPRRKAPFFTRLRACGSFQEHAPTFTREAYATRHHRQRSPRRWWLRAVALPPERLRSNGMLSDQGKRRQARKRPAELAAMAPKKRAFKQSGSGLRYARRGPHNKNQENHRGQQQGVTRS